MTFDPTSTPRLCLDFAVRQCITIDGGRNTIYCADGPYTDIEKNVSGSPEIAFLFHRCVSSSEHTVYCFGAVQCYGVLGCSDSTVASKHLYIM